MRFAYFYGTDGERFRFYMMPKTLVENPIFNSLSAEAKILYALLLDRMQLSVQNQWRDEEDRVYVIFTQEEMMEKLHCSRSKVKAVLNELDSPQGIGLIERKRQGLGKPNLLYVMDFNQPDVRRTDLQMADFHPSDGRETTTGWTEKDHPEGLKKTGINTNNKDTDDNETEVSERRRPTGCFLNVMLSEVEEADLKERLGSAYQGYLDRFSAHMKSKGIRYDDHYATLVYWHLLDEKQQAEKSKKKVAQFNYDEGDSL